MWSRAAFEAWVRANGVQSLELDADEPMRRPPTIRRPRSCANRTPACACATAVSDEPRHGRSPRGRATHGGAGRSRGRRAPRWLAFWRDLEDMLTREMRTEP